MPLPLLLLAPLAKLALGKLFVAGVAHATPAALTHAGMIAAQNVTAQAVATGTMSGAAGVAAHAAHDAYRLSRKVERYRKKRGMDSGGRKIPQNEKFAFPDEETMMNLVNIMMSLYYKDQIHYDYDGELKDKLEQIDTCQDCSCVDYDDVLQCNASTSAPKHECYCGHDWHGHSKQEETEWLLKRFAGEHYEDCNNVERDGTTKTELSQIDKCDHCDCPDFDRKSSLESQICECGHGWGSHTRSPENWQWIIIIMALLCAKELQEEDSDSSDSSDSDDDDDDGDDDDDDNSYVQDDDIVGDYDYDNDYDY